MIIHNPVITGSLQVNGTSVSSIGEVDTISGSVATLTNASASLAAGKLNNTTDTLTGDLTVTGKITAQEFHTEYVSGSIIYTSGSTKFGDTSDDTHEFVGNVGFGTDSPDYNLEISSTSATPTILLGQTPYTTHGTLLIKGTVLTSHTDDSDVSTVGVAASRYIVGNGIHTWFTSPGTVAGFSRTFTERMRIANDGNVGIGIQSPLSRLHVIAPTVGTTNDIIRWGDNSTDTGYLGMDGAGGVRIWAGGFLSFGAGGGASYSEKVRIKSDGNVGIGTDSPGEKLTVNGSIGLQYSGTQTWHIYGDSSNGLRFTRSGIADRLVITSDGSTTITGEGNTLLLQKSNNVPALGFTGATYTSVIEGGDNINFYTGGTGNRLYVTSGGYVGIGTSSPGSALHVWQTAPIISMTDSNSFSDTADRFQIRAGGDQGLIQWWDDSASSLLDLMTFEPNGQIATNSTSGLNWSTTSTGGFTVGNAAGSSLLVRTNSLNTSYNSGLAIDGTHASQRSVINIKALGVYSGGYDSHLAFYTTDNTTLSEKMRITNIGYVGIGTTSPSHPLHVEGFITTNSSSNTSGLLVRKAGTTVGYIGQSGGWEGDTTTDVAISAETGNGIRFYTNGTVTERMTLSSGGDLTLANNLYLINTKTRISSDGNGEVGINYSSGNTSTYSLSVYNSTSRVFAVKRTDGIYIRPGASYSQTYTYTSDWNANFQDVVPTGTLNSSRTYLFQIWTNSFGTPPYYAEAAAIFSTSQGTNGSGAGPEVDLITAHHVNSSTKWQLRMSTASNSSNGVQVKLLNGPSVSSVAVFIRVTELSDY